METELRKILLEIYKAKKDANDEAVERILLLFSVSVSLLSETKIVKSDDDWIECDITECCKVGPIVNENYCPKCGSKIIRNER